MYQQCPYFMYDNIVSCDDEMVFAFRSDFDEYRAIKKTFTKEEAIWIARYLNIKFDKFDVEQFRVGLDVELEHGKINPLTNITNDDPILTGKITLAHLNEFPDYYKRLLKMEKEAKKYWKHAD